MAEMTTEEKIEIAKNAVRNADICGMLRDSFAVAWVKYEERILKPGSMSMVNLVAHRVTFERGHDAGFFAGWASSLEVVASMMDALGMQKEADEVRAQVLEARKILRKDGV